MVRRTRKRLLVSLGLALAVGSLLAVAYRLGLLSTAQLQSTDFLFRARDERARATVIVGIDQRSYRELLPRYGTLVEWPRTLYAEALDRLREAGPRVVALDIFFDAPKPEDPVLAAAIGRAGNVIMPVEAQAPRESAPPTDAIRLFDVLLRPTGSLREAAAAEGLVNVVTDRDAGVRSLPLLVRSGEQDVPSLALTAVARYVRRPRVIDAAPSDGLVFAAGRAIPVVPPGRMLIDFLGPPSAPEREGAFVIVPFVDVLDGTFDPALVRDKIVVLGLTIRGVDEHATPAGGGARMWGAEVLGNAIETVLGRRFLLPASAALTTGLIVLFAAVAALLVALLRPLAAALGVLGLLGLYLLAAMVAVDNGLLLNLVYPPAALLLGFGVAVTYRVVSEQAEQRLIRGVMGRYLSPAVGRLVLEDPERLRLGGETREMTVLFSDVRGFTALSHGMDPQALTALLNEYMSAMTDVVFEHDGVLDKYIGDAIMAFWNAPLAQADHAARACAAALAMIERLRALQADWERRGVPRLELGIGINTGPMVVGNMGSNRRLAYTVLGDSVNVASRLEGLSKEYGTRTVVGVATRVAAGDAFAYRFLDLVTVKGRPEPLEVHEVVGRADALAPAHARLLERYAGAVELYRARRWPEAAEAFGALHEAWPEDGPTALYLRRGRRFATSPPPADWDGVFVAETK